MELLSIISSLVSVFTSGFCVCVLVFCIAFFHSQNEDRKRKHDKNDTDKGGGKNDRTYQGSQYRP